MELHVWTQEETSSVFVLHSGQGKYVVEVIVVIYI